MAETWDWYSCGHVYPTLNARPSLGEITPEGRVVAIHTLLMGGGTIERFFVVRDSDGRAAWFEIATRATKGTEDDNA